MAQYTRTSVGTLVNRLTDRLGNNSTFWTGVEKLDAVNEAILVWHSITGEFSQTVAFPATGVVVYTVPHQIMSITRVLFNSVPLTLTSQWELDFGFPGWSTVTGTPYYWTPIGVDKFSLYPVPTSGSISVEGYMDLPRPNVGDFVQMGDEELRALLDYAQHYCAIKEGGKELVGTRDLLKRFLAATALRNSRITASNAYQNFMGNLRDEVERPVRATNQEGGIRG